MLSLQRGKLRGWKLLNDADTADLISCIIYSDEINTKIDDSSDDDELI